MSTVTVPGFAYAIHYGKETLEELVEQNFPQGIFFLRRNSVEQHATFLGPCELRINMLPFEDLKAKKAEALQAELDAANDHVARARTALAQFAVV